VQSLFTTPLTDYDVLLHINPSVISTYAQAVSPNPTEWDGKTFRNLMTKEQVNVDYNPVYSFIKDLQDRYSETVLVFYDKHGGNVVGLVWNPEKAQPRALKAFLGYSTKPAGGDVSYLSELISAEELMIGCFGCCEQGGCPWRDRSIGQWDH